MNILLTINTKKQYSIISMYCEKKYFVRKEQNSRTDNSNLLVNKTRETTDSFDGKIARERKQENWLCLTKNSIRV